MKKQFQILGILFVLLAISVFYLLSSGDVVTIKDGISTNGKDQNRVEEIKKPEPIDIEKMEIDYKNDVSGILKEMETLFFDSQKEDKNIDFSKRADEIKDRLIKAIVPSEEYKKLHIDLVLLLTEINNNFINKSQEANADINKKITDIKVTYSWIDQEK